MVVAIDVGATKTLVALFDTEGKVKTEKKFPTNKDYDKFIEELFSVIKELGDFSAIAVALPARIDYEEEIARSFGNLGWKDVDIKHLLKKEFKVPVILDNDANLAALGEANRGAGMGHRTVLYITVSTGIGTGVTYNGKLAPVLARSEGGHILLDDKNPWEELASGKTFLAKYGKLGKDVDDPDIWQEYSKLLARGIHNMMIVIQPDIVVIGGSMGEHFVKYEGFLTDEVDKIRTMDVDAPIVQAKFPSEAVIYGCYEVAKDA